MRELDFHKQKIGSRKSLKLREIKKNKRKSRSDYQESENEFKLIFGSVWGIHDSRIKFGKIRKKEHYKDSPRPCVLLETPTQKYFNDDLFIAPGTSSQDYEAIKAGLVLTAEVPPENLNQTTYFKLQFKQYQNERFFEKRFCDLSNRLIQELRKKLNNI